MIESCKEKEAKRRCVRFHASLCRKYRAGHCAVVFWFRKDGGLLFSRLPVQDPTTILKYKLTKVDMSRV